MKSHWPLSNFIRKHSVETLFRVLADLRNGRGYAYIATYLKEDKAQVCRFINYAFARSVDFDPEIKEMLECEIAHCDYVKKKIEDELRPANIYELRQK